MLTPVDIQQKKFHVGLGYDKKDVNTFFDSVSESYEKLYRSNAELKEKVNVLNDTLQNYRSKEENLEKSLKLAEKDTVETISKAEKEAKGIIRDAKNQAKNILENSETRLEELQDEIAVLETKYAAYKSNFCTLLQKQFEFLEMNDFDVHAMIDDRAWSLLGGSNSRQPDSGSVSDNFGAYTGDPQMRDESTLGGGLNGGYGGGDVTSTSAVYTQGLSAGDNFVDPFKPKDKEEYNPFEKDNKKKDSETKLRVTDSAEARKRMKRATVGSSEATAAAEKAKAVAEGVAKPEPPKQEAPVQEPPKQTPIQEEPEPEVKQETPVYEQPKQNTPVYEQPEPKAPEQEPMSDIPTIHTDIEESMETDASDSENLEGEVEEKNGPALIGDGEEDTETEFEFI